jgi:hypothetical protein
MASTLLHRSPLLLAAAGVLLVPACSDTTTTPGLPNVARSAIQVTVEPTPVAGDQDTSTGAVSASYRVVIQEQNGLGCEVLFLNASVFDPETGLVVALNYYDGSDLLVFVGSKRVEPLGQLAVPQTVQYRLPDLRKEADLAILVQIKDDRGNVTNQAVQVKIE